jgi:hypothetical protein
MRRVIGTDVATALDRHVIGTDYDVLECGHRFRPPDGRSAPVGLAKRRACLNCGFRGPGHTTAVCIEDASPGGANLKVRSIRTPAIVWWLTRHNADFIGQCRVGATGSLAISLKDNGMPHYELDVTP